MYFAQVLSHSIITELLLDAGHCEWHRYKDEKQYNPSLQEPTFWWEYKPIHTVHLIAAETGMNKELGGGK